MIPLILEHLGILHKPSYRESWERKLQFYQENDFELDVNLFITRDEENGSIDSDKIEAVINTIQRHVV